jgi:steroid 5-alpha reductase family enzyme
MNEAFLQLVPVVATYIGIWYIISLLAKRMDVIDIAWGLGFLTVVIAGVIQRGSIDMRMGVTAALVAIWALRLASHLLRRVLSH